MIKNIADAIHALSSQSLPIAEFTPRVLQALQERGIVNVYQTRRGVRVRLCRQDTARRNHLHTTIAALHNTKPPKAYKIRDPYAILEYIGDDLAPIECLHQGGFKQVCVTLGWVERCQGNEYARLTPKGREVLRAIRLAPLK